MNRAIHAFQQALRYVPDRANAIEALNRSTVGSVESENRPPHSFALPLFSDMREIFGDPRPKATEERPQAGGRLASQTFPDGPIGVPERAPGEGFPSRG